MLFNNTTFPKSKSKRINLKKNAGLILLPTENPRIYHCKNTNGRSRPKIGDVVYLNPVSKYYITEVEERLEKTIGSKNCTKITIINAP